jgi:hypothetical protein
VKVIYIESSCGEGGECQGAFDEEGNLLSIWSSNDADWRHEYFDGMMAQLGIEVRHGRFEQALEAEAINLWG